jgi:hypothetical protein
MSDSICRLVIALAFIALGFGAGLSWMIYDLATTWDSLSVGGKLGYPIVTGMVGIIWLLMLIKIKELYRRHRREEEMSEQLLEASDIGDYFEGEANIRAYGMP